VSVRALELTPRSLHGRPVAAILASHVRADKLITSVRHNLTSWTRTLSEYFSIAVRTLLVVSLYIVASLKAPIENWTELSRHGLVFDELASKQAVMDYIRHRLTASVSTWLHARTRQPVSTEVALLTHWPECQKLHHVSSV